MPQFKAKLLLGGGKITLRRRLLTVLPLWCCTGTQATKAALSSQPLRQLSVFSVPFCPNVAAEINCCDKQVHSRSEMIRSCGYFSLFLWCKDCKGQNLFFTYLVMSKNFQEQSLHHLLSHAVSSVEKLAGSPVCSSRMRDRHLFPLHLSLFIASRSWQVVLQQSSRLGKVLAGPFCTNRLLRSCLWFSSL